MEIKTAWLFDVDGVLTHPEAKSIVLPEIFDELIKRLEKGESVGFNTGRSVDFIVEQVLQPLEEKMKNKNLLKNIFAIGEKGAIVIFYNEDGERVIDVDSSIGIPIEVEEQVKKIISNPLYSDIVFFDSTKQTMTSVELKPGVTVAEFKEIQPNLTSELKSLLMDNNLESDFKIDSTRIAVDIENKNTGKALGARKFVELLTENEIFPEKYICFGDATSDYEMFQELKDLSKKSKFVFVGEKELLDGLNLESVIFTKNITDDGTLEYLKNNE